VIYHDMKFILKIILLGTSLTGGILVIFGNQFTVPIVLILLFVILAVGGFKLWNRSVYRAGGRSYWNINKMWNPTSSSWEKSPTEEQKRIARKIGYKGGGTKRDYWHGIRNILRGRR